MVTHNNKGFLVPQSHRTMSSFHAKVMEDGIMKFTIHDCKSSIQLHNDLNDPEQLNEAMQKLSTLASAVVELQDFIYQNYLQK